MSGQSGRITRKSHRSVGSFVRHFIVLTVGFTAMVSATSLSACSSSTLGREMKATSGPNLITEAEISKASVQNALEAVQKLRPAMLQRQQAASANAQSRGEIVVYVDNNRYGPVEQLRQIPSSSIFAVRYFSASESQLKWGSGHPSGVIEVITKR
jgi:hypothetical protein